MPAVQGPRRSVMDGELTIGFRFPKRSCLFGGNALAETNTRPIRGKQGGLLSGKSISRQNNSIINC